MATLGGHNRQTQQPKYQTPPKRQTDEDMQLQRTCPFVFLSFVHLSFRWSLTLTGLFAGDDDGAERNETGGGVGCARHASALRRADDQLLGPRSRRATTLQTGLC